MSSFLQLVQDLQRELGTAGAPVTTVLGQTSMNGKLVGWIADADIDIQNIRTDWNFLWSQYSEDTAIGTAEPPIPSDLNIWDLDTFYLNHSLATNKKLSTDLDYRTWLNGRGRGVQVNRKPSFVVVKPDNQIILSSTPDAVYALTANYWKTPVKMTGNSDISAIPAHFHRIIVVRAKLMYAEEQESPDVYKSAYAELYGDPRERNSIGLIDQLKASQLPNQERRTRSEGAPVTIRPE